MQLSFEQERVTQNQGENQKKTTFSEAVIKLITCKHLEDLETTERLTGW